MKTKMEIPKETDDKFRITFEFFDLHFDLLWPKNHVFYIILTAANNNKKVQVYSESKVS